MARCKKLKEMHHESCSDRYSDTCGAIDNGSRGIIDANGNEIGRSSSYGNAGMTAPIAAEPPPRPSVRHDAPSPSPPQNNSPTWIVTPDHKTYVNPTGGGGTAFVH